MEGDRTSKSVAFLLFDRGMSVRQHFFYVFLTFGSFKQLSFLFEISIFTTM